jgi:hypothetical protein
MNTEAVLSSVAFVLVYPIWTLCIAYVDVEQFKRTGNKMFVQYSLLDGKEVQENIEKERLDFIGFWVTKEEKKTVLKMAEDSNVNVSDLCRHVLYLDPVKNDLKK